MNPHFVAQLREGYIGSLRGALKIEKINVKLAVN
jgi:hypothetical protein